LLLVEGRASVRDVELAYGVRGSGTVPFVWGHGLMSNRAADDEGLLLNWEEIEGAARVVRYDARGHGESDTSVAAESYRWSEMALDQLALVDELGIDRFVAGGASLGAATALHVAVAAPDRIAALVLVIPPTAWDTRADQVDLYQQMADVTDRAGVEPLVRAAAVVPPPDPFVGRDEWVGRSERRLREAGAERLSVVFRGAATADLPSAGAVAEIGVPTLVLAWSGDPGHPVSTAERLGDLIDGSEVRVAASWDELSTWTPQVVEFLRRVA
jgi:pimeloyl-ACP methyl ester carboxylesterase